MKKKQRGIYITTDVSAGKAYIGSTIDKDVRFEDHARYLKSNRHTNWKLQRAYNKGNVLETLFIPVTNNVDIRNIEKELINEYWDSGLLYNVSKDTIAPMEGRKHSKESLEKMRIARTGIKQSDETKKKRILTLTGLKKSPEHIEKIAATKRGIPHSAEARKRMSASSAKALPIIVDNIVYSSTVEASKSLGVTPAIIKRRLNSSKEEYSDWRRQIDLEVKDRAAPLPPLPIELTDVIAAPYGKRSEAEEAKVTSLYHNEFIAKNEHAD
jgi:group I intron endonuclease